MSYSNGKCAVNGADIHYDTNKRRKARPLSEPEPLCFRIRHASTSTHTRPCVSAAFPLRSLKHDLTLWHSQKTAYAEYP
jgi:hypothetical protein